MPKNASVRSMFDMLCDLHCGNTHGYVYEMIATPSALADAIKRMAWDNERLKLLATFLNSIGVAIFAVGGLAPVFSSLYGAGRPTLFLIIVGTVCF